MSNNVTVSGTLVSGPPQASDTAFPSAVTNAVFALNPPQLQAAVQTGAQVRQVNSPSAFVPLDGVGAGETVTQGNLIYIRVTNPMRFRFTFTNTPVDDVVGPIHCKGPLLLQVDEAHPLKLAEVEGSGIVEYFISGNQ